MIKIYRKRFSISEEYKEKMNQIKKILRTNNKKILENGIDALLEYHELCYEKEYEKEHNLITLKNECIQNVFHLNIPIKQTTNVKIKKIKRILKNQNLKTTDEQLFIEAIELIHRIIENSDKNNIKEIKKTFNNNNKPIKDKKG